MVLADAHAALWNFSNHGALEAWQRGNGAQ
jgi:hypothetical protein